MFGALRSWFVALDAELIVGTMPSSLVAQRSETTRGQVTVTITDSTAMSVTWGPAWRRLARHGRAMAGNLSPGDRMRLPAASVPPPSPAVHRPERADPA